MARFTILIGSLIAAFSFSAHAGFVNLKPPPGWTQGGGAVASVGQGVFTMANAGAATSIILGRIGANAALTVAGSEAAIPVAMRLGAGAAAVAAEFAFANPYLFVAGVAASAALAWYDSNHFKVQDGIWMKDTPTEGTGFEYRTPNMPSGIWVGSSSAACNSWIGVLNAADGPSGYTVTVSSSTYPTCTGKRVFVNTPGSFQTVSSSISRRTVVTYTPNLKPVPLAEFVSTLRTQKVPDPAFKGFPGYVQWPVDLPYIDPVTDEESTSFGRPFLVPTGLPILSPDALSWNQPAVRVTPAPTVSNPWRVDTTPVNVPQSTGTPKTSDQLNPKPVTVIDPVTGLPTTTEPDTGTPTPDKPIGLCDEFPDILACQKLGSAEVPDLPEQSPSIAITPDSGWGASSGVCPADRYAPRSGLLIASFQPACDFMTGIKPVVIAMAWLAGAFILLGLKGGDS